MNPLDLHVVAACAVSPEQPGGAVGLLAACTLEVQADQPFIRLVPAGEFHASRGALMGAGPWHLDADLAAALMARVRERAPLPIDYEHQTLLAERNGLPAPAAGWIDPAGLEWREDGLYGPVTWTPRAAAMLREGEYRYLSPVFTYSAEDGAVRDLLHAALTNQPAIDTESLHRAAARLGCAHQSSTETPKMPDPIRAKLGVPEESDTDAVVQAIDALQARVAQTQEQVAAASRAAAPDPAQYVPIAAHQEQVAALRARLAAQDESELEREIAAGLEDGTIAGPAMAAHLRTLGVAACREHRASMGSIAALTRTQTQGRASEGKRADAPALSGEELAVCKAMGLDPKDYLAAKPSAEEATR